jgi:hypothetical protein
VKIKPGSAQLTNSEKCVKASIHQKKIAPASQAGRPCHVEPAQIHGESESEQNQGIAQVAPLFRVGHARLLHQPGHRDRQKRVEGNPLPSEDAVRDGQDDVGQN